ncbi:FAD-binding protein [Deferribacterales bacterium RsTz2092]|nr:electron transfer flavoprotein subunit alpha [Deferribacterales bacterium]
MKALIFSDRLNGYAELVAASKSLGAEAVAFIVASKDEAGKCPASKVYQSDVDSSKMLDDYFPALRSVVDIEKPDVVLISATKRGKLMAGRLAAVNNTSAITDISSLEVDGDAFIGEQMYYGGIAVRTLKSKVFTIVTIPQGTFDATGVVGTAGEAVNVPVPATSGKIVRKEVRPKAGGQVNLADAKRVVSVGRGFVKREDLNIAQELASAICAELGCTRPVAEGEGWMETARYIGVSGVSLKPDVYLAVGISGQVQHTIGIGSAKTIIAVNKDKNAPIFKCCDYGIVGDLYKIVPELTKLIRG